MILLNALYDEKNFDSAIGRDLLPLKCCNCACVFFRSKIQIRRSKMQSTKATNQFCSKNCMDTHTRNVSRVTVACAQCSNELIRSKLAVEKSTSKLFFCDHSCCAKYQNTHKTGYVRRSKLEVWLEQQLTQLYPSLEIHFNRKDTINSELDIYIPSLKLAFELNGIFHYEPIYGPDKLNKIQNNDQRKFAACLERGIELCIIDTSKQKYFKEKWIRPYLNIVVQVLSVKAERLRSEHTT